MHTVQQHRIPIRQNWSYMAIRKTPRLIGSRLWFHLALNKIVYSKILTLKGSPRVRRSSGQATRPQPSVQAPEYLFRWSCQWIGSPSWLVAGACVGTAPQSKLKPSERICSKSYLAHLYSWLTVPCSLAFWPIRTLITVLQLYKHTLYPFSVIDIRRMNINRDTIV